MKKYETLEMQVIVFNATDVLTTSGEPVSDYGDDIYGLETL
jgi:hypothetical protein